MLQPPVDLGQTSFLDGETGHGGLIELIASGSLADDSLGSDAGQVRISGGSVLIHGAYICRYEAFANLHLGVAGYSYRPIGNARIDGTGTAQTGNGSWASAQACDGGLVRSM